MSDHYIQQKSLWELATELMRQICQWLKSNQVLINADYRVLNMFYLVFDDLGTPLYFILTESYLPLVSNAGAIKWKKETITEARKLRSHQKSSYFYTVHFVNEQWVAKQERADNPD